MVPIPSMGGPPCQPFGASQRCPKSPVLQLGHTVLRTQLHLSLGLLPAFLGRHWSESLQTVPVPVKVSAYLHLPYLSP